MEPTTQNRRCAEQGQEIQKAVMSIESTEDLKAVQRTIRVRWEQLEAMAALDWKVGDECEFNGRGGFVCRGVIAKKNPTRLKVKGPNGRSGPKEMWSVYPMHLRAPNSNWVA